MRSAPQGGSASKQDLSLRREANRYSDWADFIKAFTDVDDIVFDPFCGTASIGHACHLLKRRYIGTDKFMTAGTSQPSPSDLPARIILVLDAEPMSRRTELSEHIHQKLGTIYADLTLQDLTGPGEHRDDGTKIQSYTIITRHPAANTTSTDAGRCCTHNADVSVAPHRSP